MGALKLSWFLAALTMGAPAFGAGTALDPVKECSGALTEWVEVAGLKVSADEKKEAEARVAVVAERLVEMVKAPQKSTEPINLPEAFSINKNAAERARRFITNNSLLDRKMVKGKEDDSQAVRIGNGLDQLLQKLEHVKGLTSWKVKVIRAAMKVPGSKLVIGREPLSKYITLKQQVLALGDSVEGDVKLLEKNNDDLRRLSTSTTEEARLMIREIVYIQLLKDQLETLLATDPDFADPKMAEDFKIQILSQLETLSIDQKSLQTVLVASTESISQQIVINMKTISGAKRTLNVAQPSIIITASIQLAAQDAQKVMDRDEKLREVARKSFNDMTKAVIAGNKTVAKLAGSGVFSLQSLEENIGKLRQSREEHRREMNQIYETTRAESRRFDQIMREGQLMLEEQEVRHKMDLLIDGTNGSPPARREY